MYLAGQDAQQVYDMSKTLPEAQRLATVRQLSGL